MLDKPQFIQFAGQRTAVIRLQIPRYKIREVMGPGIAELMATAKAQGLAPTGPVFSHHFRMHPDTFDFEIGIPVSAPITPSGRVEPSELKPATVARTVYCGPYEGLGNAWGEFVAWIKAEGHTPAPNLWECYLKGSEASSNPNDWATELNRPLVV